MGLNLFEGLRAASQSFGQLASYQEKREQESALQLREENLLRLKNQLDTTHDVQIEGMKNAQTDKNQANYLDRIEKIQDHSDKRQDQRLRDQDDRQSRALDASEKRQDDRMDQQMELTTRKGMSDQVKAATLARQKAVDDMGRIKSRMAAYLKQQAPMSGLDPDNPTSIIDLAKKDPQALSYFQDLRDANARRKQADAFLQGPAQGFKMGAGTPSVFDDPTSGDSNSLIPPSMLDEDPNSGAQ